MFAKTKIALDNVISWVLTSSANPSAVSLTLKGALLLSVPAIMSVAGLAHLNLGSDQLTAVFDGVATFVQALLTVVASAIALYGAFRKIWNTVTGATSV